LTKQGNRLLQFLWAEAGGTRRTPELQRSYRRKLIHKGFEKASVAVARKLGIRRWSMLRDQIEYNEVLSSWTAAAEEAISDDRPYRVNHA